MSNSILERSDEGCQKPVGKIVYNIIKINSDPKYVGILPTLTYKNNNVYITKLCCKNVA